MVRVDQCSVWVSDEATHAGSQIKKEKTPGPSSNHQQQLATTPQSFCCPKSVLFGVIIGALISGVALATVLTLYLHKPSSSSAASVTTESLATTTTPGFYINLVQNGDAETGFCSANQSISSPTGWSYSGSISQLSYNSSFVNGQSYSTSGPSNRGRCYFFGQISASTSMWQTITLTNYASPQLIDSSSVRFNLSAWLGGIMNQDDSASVTLTFSDFNNHTLGNTTSIGPILAIDRGSISSLIFQQANGMVPIGARTMTVLVTITRFSGTSNDGAADDIALLLYS